MATLSEERISFEQALANLLETYGVGPGSGTIIPDRLTLINYVKAKLDEIIPEGEGVQFSVEGDINISDPLNLLINAILDEAAKRVLLNAPLNVLEGVDAKSLPVVQDGGTRASVKIDMTNANADLTYIARETGTDGNSITVTHTDPGAPDQALQVSVVGSDITISLATDSGSAITSTAAQVKAAVDAHSGASALVTVKVEGDGSGVVNAVAQTSLSGGVNGSGETGYIELPDNFLRLITLKMTDWKREVTQAITTSDKRYWVQKNKYIRGGTAKPVAVFATNQIGGFSIRTIEYYSVSTNHTIEKLLIIQETKAEDVQSNLVDALTWVAAGMVLQITERVDLAKVAFEQEQLSYQKL
jgi:hypothetical protein